MEVRECYQEDCPYCYWSMSIMGKRKSFCSMNRPFLTVGCPRRDIRSHSDIRSHGDIRSMDLHMRKFADF